MNSEIKRIHEMLKSKEISCLELVNNSIKALKENKNNTANFVLEEYATHLAKKVDQKIKEGKEIKLFEGIPFGIKDVFMLEGQPASGSAAILKNYIAPYTATAVQKLLDEGAIPVVKENSDAFGHGSTNENSIFGAAINALDDQLVAGGSSGGSAVNVAKKYTVFSLGGDTGGSIRQPAGFNKVVGLKPTYGAVSRYGIMAYASSTDCVGPIANSVDDIAEIMNIIAGRDEFDQTTFKSRKINLEKSFDLEGVKIGFYKSFIENENIDKKIKKDFEDYLEKLRNDGAQIIPLEIFDSQTLVATYYTLAMAETASNLSRLDGTNYGERSSKANLKEGYAETRSANFSEESKRRIVGGNQVLSQGYADDIYLKALDIRSEIEKSFQKDFKTVDFIVSPLAPEMPPKIGTSNKDLMKMYLSDAYTVGFSLGGLPTICIPKGTEIGVQLTANKKEENALLQLADFLNSIV